MIHNQLEAQRQNFLNIDNWLMSRLIHCLPLIAVEFVASIIDVGQGGHKTIELVLLELLEYRRLINDVFDNVEPSVEL